MTSSIEVDEGVLKQAADVWREQSYAATQATNGVSGADTHGFDDDVRSAVQRYLDTWSAVTKKIAANVDDVSLGLDEYRQGVGEFENKVQEGIDSLGRDLECHCSGGCCCSGSGSQMSAS